LDNAANDSQPSGIGFGISSLREVRGPTTYSSACFPACWLSTVLSLAPLLDATRWTLVQSNALYIPDTSVLCIPYLHQLFQSLSWPGVRQVCQWLKDGLSVDPSKP
ncbi:unnamed protein product, partial [Ectocarpus sp. 4 AP-2014]